MSIQVPGTFHPEAPKRTPDSFDALGLSQPVLRAVKAEGYESPTPIQSQAIPHVLEGRDLLGCAQTGTGKTAAFALPILHRLGGATRHGRRPIRALVLTPTRELAVQIHDAFRAYGRYAGLRCTVVHGGVSQNPQTSALGQGVDILVATPGRLLDLMGQGFIDLRLVESFVLDEADRMLDMGFIHDVRRIVASLPARRQTLLFSATMPPEIRDLAGAILTEPITVHAAPPAARADRIEQTVYYVDRARKPDLLRRILDEQEVTRVLVFTRTKHGADRLGRQLARSGIQAAILHGDKAQGARQRAIESFRTRATPVLVATDVAARGLDIDAISHVVNYDLPAEPETYVHRIGRTARAGASGVALSFCDFEERAQLFAIERLIREPLPVVRDAASTPSDQPLPEPTVPERAEHLTPATQPSVPVRPLRRPRPVYRTRRARR
ncbi:MAG: DEAD/DEAH box helicase [Chthonomonadales bacterium]|nr:DEAD/DEAH box helicase [Chthonomonadales bacterium]